MKNIENEYNKRFKNQEMDNSDFDVNGLWDAITEDLDDAMTPPTPPKGGSPFFKYLGFGFGLLFLIGLGFVYLSKPDSTQRLATKENTTKELKKTQSTNNQPITPKNTTEEEVPNASNQQASTGHIPVINNHSNTTNDISRKKRHKVIKSNPVERNLNTIPVENHFSRKSNIKNREPNPDILNQPISINKTQELISESGNQSDIANTSSQLPESSIKAIPTQKINPNEINKSIAAEQKKSKAPQVEIQKNITETADTKKHIVDNSMTDLTSTDSITKHFEPQKSPTVPTGQPNSNTDYTNQGNSLSRTNDSMPNKISDVSHEEKSLDSLAKDEGPIPSIKPAHLKNINWAISLMGGTNKTFFNFNSKDDLAKLRNNHEKGTWGTSFGVNVGMVWKNKVILSSGLEYHTLWSKLDYTQVKTRMQDSVLQEVFITQNGQILTMAYDSLTRSSKKQTIWNNQYKTYRIPLEIGYQKHIKNWIIGARVGAIFNFTTSQKGKTFDNEQVIASFTQVDSFAPLKSFQIGFRVSPFIDFQLTDKTSLRFAPKWNWYKGQTAGIQEVGLGIGLGVKF